MACSVVRWLGADDKGHRCGYCRNPNGSFSLGLWTFSLTPMHYQLMIDRGWRRSGQYCYQPRYRESCCQLYTIRCRAADVILTKSMRNSCKRMYDFLVFDKKPSKHASLKFKAPNFSVEPSVANGVWRIDSWISKNDSNKHLERILSAASNDWFNTPHSLSVLLVRSWPPSEFFKATYREEHLIYMAYQTAVHKDPPSKVDLKQFAGFLVETSFICDSTAPTDLPTYGAYHMQFRIDNRLVAVSVIDILPYCVSSVYCFYDPAFTFLNLGTYTALYEIALARAFTGAHMAGRYPDLKYYYMGFYINTCKKMRYKGQYRPAELLCPEAKTWHPIEQALVRIEEACNKYTRLDPNFEAQDADGDKAASFVARNSRKRSPTEVLPIEAARSLGFVCTREFELA